jgi:peptidoglycan/xylan/chitin deacetylase (PgdA/CDA1 family)
MSEFHFTFYNIKKQYQKAIEAGYDIITCEEYYQLKKAKRAFPSKILINRVDIDLSVKKTERLVDIFNELNIKATFFLRLHAPEYNPFSFENYRIIKKLISSGHELGYHSEIVDQAAIWGEEAGKCLIRDVSVINSMFDVKITGVASHGGMTGLNNLDFWKDKKAKDFGLNYEAYDKQSDFNLFQEAFYISDSEWIKWKCYDKGKLIGNDRRSLEEHIESAHPILHVLIHPDTYFDRHFYE